MRIYWKMRILLKKLKNVLKSLKLKTLIVFSKSLQEEKKQKIHNLENTIKVLETKLHNDENIKLYNKHKQELDELFLTI